MKNNLIPELLAPAGSFAALEAAVAGGADAVYLGCEEFNARINAANFTLNGIKEAVSYCHKRGVRVHVTLNTLILDRELKKALETAHTLYLAGVDALIVADVALAREIHKNMPDLELHASTQLSGHNADAADLLKEIGFSRMVCARELSGDDIASLCKNSPLPIEMFIHGALCVSHSGQCLMSSFIGGRSGNRGLCAQPCRMQYNGGRYPLSLKDNCLAPHIPEIIKTGVASLKIEGRMKRPEYVYGVTRIYRRLLDENRGASEKEMQELASLFSRQGFTDGYFTKTISTRMNGIRTEDNKTSARKGQAIKPKAPVPAEKRISEPKREGVTLTLENTKKTGATPTLTARFTSPLQIPKDHPFDIAYLPLECADPVRAKGVILPPVIYDRDRERIAAELKRAKENGAEHLLITNIGQLDIAKGSGLALHGDFRLNIFNMPSASYWIERGLCDVIISPELTLPQIRDIKLEKSVIVYGNIPLMLLEKRLNTNELCDRTGARFPVALENGRSVVLNSCPTYMADKENDLMGAGIVNRHFIFTKENANEVSAVISAYKQHKPTKATIRRIKNK